MDYFDISICNELGVLVWVHINGDDGSIIKQGQSELSSEVNLYDDFYFSQDGLYRKVDDGNGNVKKLAVMFQFSDLSFINVFYNDGGVA